MELSFWEKNTWFSNIDVLIAGAGIVGLSAAINLYQKDRHLKILVVDRGFLPYGASTRNAGFACFGSLGELTDDLDSMSESAVITLVLKRWNGLKKLRSLLKDANIGYEGSGGFELFMPDEKEEYEKSMHNMSRFNSLLKPETGIDNIYTSGDHLIPDFGFKNVNHLIANRFEGQIDTGKMMSALLNKTRNYGIDVLNGIDIKNFSGGNGSIYINTSQGFCFSCKKILITTDGFAKQLLPDLDVNPARAQVLVTKPIPDLKVRGTFHFDKGYYYFRNIGNRLLFGGARNLDFVTENTMEFGRTSTIENRLDELIKEIILPGIPYEVDQRWSGIMGMGSVKEPIIRKVDNNIYCAVRSGGMGIAIGSLTGEEAAELVLND
jgi:gamma-glutamylputrescine oxidase